MNLSASWRYQLWIVAAAGIVFFTNLGGAGLWDMDEALYSTCAREMAQRGDWVVPWFNGQMFPEKPPLMFWTMMGGFELCGVNEWGARFFSAVFGIATALAAFHLGRLLFNARVGLWTGLITASTIIFTVSARAATVDAALTLVTTLAFLMFVVGRKVDSNGKVDSGQWAVGSNSPPFAIRHSPSSDSQSPIPNPSASPVPRPSFPLRYAVLMYACIGLAVLGKGPVGMVLPLAAMGMYLLVVDGWRNALRSAWWMRPLTAIIVLAAVALPWYVWVGVRTDGEWLRRFFIEFNLRPFKQPILGHGDVSSLDRTLAVLASLSYYFYQIPAILVGFFPWSVFLGPTVVDVYERLRKRVGAPSPFSHGCLLAVCWFGVWFVFWSICKTKLPHYLLPAYPALAMLVACFVERWQSDPGSLKPWWLRNAWISMILVGLAIAIAIPIVARIYLPGEEMLGLVGAIPLLGGLWCWRASLQDRPQSALVGFALTSILFLTVMFAWGSSRVDRFQNAKPMIAAIRSDAKNSSDPFFDIATYRFFRESIVCYAGYPVTRCEGNDEEAVGAMTAFLAESPRSYVITTDEHEPTLQKLFPGRWREIFRQPRFMAPGEMVVLAAENEK